MFAFLLTKALPLLLPLLLLLLLLLPLCVQSCWWCVLPWWSGPVAEFH
jgi:hypothetical protein